ncbi:hypothetical protein KEM54_006290 [Ascosphaera aggregata]|nr:hypothetical protein KEM54_006290 [Ascosphaera aggregata]
MNPGDQGNDPMGTDPWASVNHFFNLEQTPDASFIDWDSVMLEAERTAAASLPAAGRNSVDGQSQLQPQVQGQPGLHPQMHHPTLYRQQLSQQPQQSSLPQSWQHSQGGTTSQSHMMQDSMQNYQLLSQYHVSEANQYQLSYGAQSQQSVTTSPAPPRSQSQLQGQTSSYTEFSLEPTPTPVPSQPQLQSQQQQSHEQQVFQNVRIPIDPQKQSALQQQPARQDSLQPQHTPIDAPRPLQQLAPAPIRNPMSHHGSHFMDSQARSSAFAHLLEDELVTTTANNKSVPQQQQVQHGQQHNPYHNTINPQFLAPSQTYGHAHDPFIVVNPVEANHSHHPINARSSAIPATLDTSQIQIGQHYTQSQGHATQAPPQQPQITSQLSNGRPNMVWGSPSHPEHAPLQPYSMVQQLQPYGGVQHQMQPLVAPQPTLQKPIQGQAQMQMDPALPIQQYQETQQHQGAQFLNSSAAANPQKQGQSAPSTTSFQVQIPLKDVKLPKNGTVINLESLKMPVRRKKKDTTLTTTSVKKKQAQPRKIASGAGAGSTITLDGSSSSASSSDYSSESEADKTITPESSPIPPTRPTDAKGASRYDAIKAVWAPRNRRTTASTVRNALMTFSDLVKGMRDTWKSKTEALKEAESKHDEAGKKKLGDQVEEAKEVFDIAVKTAMEWGHPAVIQR